ncbi:MAG: hypothetical protein HZB39_11305, partial [Planctomycetes bacterium]|nr:hypothetical protein [Planctomycetota bacterium]
RDGEVEQSFVLAVPDGDGDLVVRLALDTELVARADGDGIRFEASGLGHVTYGGVIAFDAAGRRFAGASRLDGHRIELVVPHAFLAAAQGLVTIDPIIRTISIDGGADDNTVPDVAYERSNDRWLVVYQRTFSGTDKDVISRRYNGSGTFMEEIAVATGSRESTDPAVGANTAHTRFLIVWVEDTGLGVDHVLLARKRASASTSQDPTFLLRDSPNASDRDPAVGGSISVGPNGEAWAVAFEVRPFVGGTSSVDCARVELDQTVLVQQVSSSGEHATAPCISECNSLSTDWLCSWVSGAVFPFEIRAATQSMINIAGLSAIIESRSSGGRPTCAGEGPEWVVMYANSDPAAPGNHDLFGAILRKQRAVLSVVTRQDLTILEPGAILLADQIQPALGWDGCRYTYAYLESTGSAGNFEALAANFMIESNGFEFFDGHRGLHGITQNQLEQAPAIASRGAMHADPGVYLIAWQTELSSTNHDIVGALFLGGALTGGVTTVTTHCGIIPAAIRAENEPVLGAVLRIVTDAFQPSNQLYVLGLRAPSPIPLCSQGCALGVNPIFDTIPGASLSLPIPCQSGLVGAEFAVQNLLLFRLGGCAPPSFPLDLATTDTLVIRIQ